MAEIIPAVLSSEKSELARVARSLQGLAHALQLDVCDGIFAGAPTWPYTEGKLVPSRGELIELAQDIPVEIDLMAKDPAPLVSGWAQAGAARVIVHAESADNLPGAVEAVRQSGAECGVAISIATPLALIAPVLDSVDFVQCMGIRTIGWQGEPFEMAVVSHVRELRAMRPALTISVDGGVSRAHVRELVEAGASRLVVGSTIVKAPDIKAAFEEIRIIANG